MDCVRERISILSGVPISLKWARKRPSRIALVGVGDVLERVAVDDDDRRIHAALVRVAQLGAEHAGALAAAWCCTASCSSRVSTGVGILRVADACASAIAFQTGPKPWRLVAEMVSTGANFRNGSRCSIERSSVCFWYASTASHLLTATTTARPLSRM